MAARNRDDSFQTSTYAFVNDDIRQFKINEIYQPEYGYYVWPCSLVMANFIYENRSTLFNSTNLNMLELGSGTSMGSIVARMFTKIDKVFITDSFSSSRSRLRDLIRFTLESNGIEYGLTSDDQTSRTVLFELDWINYDPKVLSSLPTINFIIGSDVFFDSKCNPMLLVKSTSNDLKKVFEDLIVLVRVLIDFNNPDLIFYTTFEKRSTNYHLKLMYLCEKYSLQVKHLDLPSPQLIKHGQTDKNSLDSHEIFLLEISSNKKQ